MKSLVKLTEMLDRVKNGRPCTMREWETEIIPKAVKKYLRKYELERTFNGNIPVNQDLNLADRFFQAGLDLATEIGLFCPETETTVTPSREEILAAALAAPANLPLGMGDEKISIKARFPEDPAPPIFGAPLAIQVSEDLYVPIMEGILRCPRIRIHVGPSLDTVFDYPVYSGTPFETIMAFRENRLREEAQWRAGRIGIANESIASSTTEYGNLAGFAGSTSMANPAMALVLHPAELKVCYASFHKAAAAIGYGGYVFSGTNSMIGGYSGGAEGAALANIATDLLQFPVMQAVASNSSVYDVRYDSTCGRHGLWALSIVCQAISRNTHLLIHKVINQSAGPCTEDILYTSAAGYLVASVCGMSFTVGPRTAGGKYKNYLTPLEHQFCAELFEGAAGLSLEQTNELVLYLLPKYEKTLKNQPKGKSFLECYDPKTLTPIKEWQEIYDRVRTDLERRGVSFN